MNCPNILPKNKILDQYIFILSRFKVSTRVYAVSIFLASNNQSEWVELVHEIYKVGDCNKMLGSEKIPQKKRGGGGKPIFEPKTK